MSSYFRLQHFVAVSRNLGGRILAIDDVLSSHAQEYYPTTSLDENCINFQTDRKFYVDLRQRYLALKQKFVKRPCYETYNTKKLNKEHKKEAKADEETAEEEQEAPVFLVAHVSNILHTVFLTNKVYINNQQLYTSNGFIRTSITFATSAWTPSLKTKNICSAMGTINRNFLMKLSKILCLNLFAQGERKDSVNLMALWYMGNWKFNFSQFLICCIRIWKLRYDYSESDLILTWLVATPTLLLYLLLVHFALLVLRSRTVITGNEWICLHEFLWSSTNWRLQQRFSSFQLNKTSSSKKTPVLAYSLVQVNYMEVLAKTFIIPAWQNRFTQENIFNNAPVRRNAIAVNETSAFTGSYTKKPFWYHQIDLRQIRRLRNSQPFVGFDTADNWHLYVTTMKAMNFPDEIPLTPIDIFNHH